MLPRGRLLSAAGSRRVIGLLGSLFVVFAVGRAVLASGQGEPAVNILIITLMIGVPGFLLVYGAYWLASTDIDPDFYPHIARWCLAGFGVMTCILVVYHLQPGESVSTRAPPILTALASVAGFAVGINDGQARTRTYEVETRNQQLEQYETVVETAHDGIYVLDEERRFELVNESFVGLTTFSRSELLGQHASTVFGDEFVSTEAEQWKRATPDELPLFEETIAAGPNETRTVENRFVLLDESGGEKRIGVLRDVTERKAYQRKLEESEQRYRTLVESFPSGAITMFTEDLRYTFADGQILEEIDLQKAQRECLGA
ncbi:PAS domain S-box protein [Natrialbaceae archaeon A-CW1-1]